MALLAVEVKLTVPVLCKPLSLTSTPSPTHVPLTRLAYRRNGRAPRAQPAVAPVPATKALQLPSQMGQGSKIIVSNLPPDVTENQIRELFFTTVGHVTRVILSYDSRGASKGTAQVEFKRNEDATKAFQQYNKVTFYALLNRRLIRFRTGRSK